MEKTERGGADQSLGIHEITDTAAPSSSTSAATCNTKARRDSKTKSKTSIRHGGGGGEGSSSSSLLVGHSGVTTSTTTSTTTNKSAAAFSPPRGGSAASTGRGPLASGPPSSIADSESPPGSSTTATLTTTSGSSSGAPSLSGGPSSAGDPSSAGESGDPSNSGNTVLRFPHAPDLPPHHHHHHHHPLQGGFPLNHGGGGRYPADTMYENGRYHSNANNNINNTSNNNNNTNPNTGRYPVAIKLLVSNNVAGSIIGRQGQTISELQSRSLTRIKLSQSGDYFPGTHDRVCLVQGEPGHIKTALRLLLERMHVLHEQESGAAAPGTAAPPVTAHPPPPTTTNIAPPTTNPPPPWQLQPKPAAAPPGMAAAAAAVPSTEGTSPSFVVRLLVPSSSCGMIIGKAGSNIKYLEETTGVVSVRLSPKDSQQQQAPLLPQPPLHAESLPGAASERALTITGPSLDSCLQCTMLIFEGMMSHPDVSRYLNMTTSYARKPGRSGPATAPSPITSPPPPGGDMLLSSSGGFPDVPAMMFPGTTGGMPPPPSIAGAAYPQPLPPPHAQPLAAPPPSHPAQTAKLGSSSSGAGKTLTPKRMLPMPEIVERDADVPQDPSPPYDYKGTSLSSAEMVFSPPLLPASFPSPGNERPLPYTSFPPPPTSMDDPDALQQQQHHTIPGMTHSSSAPDLFGAQLDPQPIHYTPVHDMVGESPSSNKPSPPPPQPPPPQPPQVTASPPTGSSNHSYLIPVAPTCMGPNAFQAQIAVPDSMIGSILGRAGRTLNELQLMSGTRIWISQRGEFIPGTRNRVVTVRGPTAQSVWQTQLLIGQRIVLPPTATTNTGPGSNPTTNTTTADQAPPSSSSSQGPAPPPPPQGSPGQPPS